MRLQIRFELESEQAEVASTPVIELPKKSEAENTPKPVASLAPSSRTPSPSSSLKLQSPAVTDGEIEEEVKRRLEINKGKWEEQARKQFAQWKERMQQKVKNELQDYALKKKQQADELLKKAEQEAQLQATAKLEELLGEERQKAQLEAQARVQEMIAEWEEKQAQLEREWQAKRDEELELWQQERDRDYQNAIKEALNEAHRRELEILEKAKEQATREASQLMAQAKNQKEKMVQEAMAKIEKFKEELDAWKAAQTKAFERWQSEEKEKISIEWRNARQKSKKIMEEASHEAQRLLESSERDLRERELAHAEKMRLQRKELELELEEKRQSGILQLKQGQQELSLARQQHEVELKRKEQQYEELIHKAKHEADLIVQGALRSKYLISEKENNGEGGAFGQGSFLAYSARMIEERQKIQTEWSQILAREFEEQRTTLTRKIELEAQERALNIIAKAQDEAAIMINEAYRESGKIYAEGELRFQEMQTESEKRLSLLNQEISVKESTCLKWEQEERDLAQKFRDTDQQYKFLKNQFEDLIIRNAEEETAHLKRQKELQAILHKLESQRDELIQQEQNCVQNLFTARQEHQKISNELQEELLQLKSMVYPLRNEKEKLLQDTQTLELKVEELRSVTNRLILEETNQSSRLQDLRRNIEASESEFQSLQRQLEETGIQLEEIRTKHENWQRALKELEVSHEEMRKEKLASFEQEYRPLLRQLEDGRKELAEVRHKKEVEAKKGIDEILAETRKKAESDLVAAKREASNIIAEAKKKEQSSLKRLHQLEAQAEQKAKQSAEQMIANYRDKNRSLIEQVELKQAELKAIGETMEQVKTAKLAEIEKESLVHKKELYQKYQVEISRREQEWEKKQSKIEENANLQASKLIQEATSLRESAQSELANIRSNAQSLVQKEVEQIHREMENLKAQTQQELTQTKVKELELIRRQIASEKERFTHEKDSIVRDLAFNLKNQLTPKLASYVENLARAPQGSEKSPSIDQLLEGLGPILKGVIFPDQQNKAGGKVLLGSGKVATSVKIFWLKVSAAVFIPLAFLVHYLSFPEFYSSVKQEVVSSLTEGESATDLYMKKEMEKRKEKAVFAPTQDESFKGTFTDNILFTKNYKILITQENFKKNWTLELNTYLVDQLLVSENLVVKIMGMEAAIHNTLLELSEKINGEYAEEGIKRMREAEAEQMTSLKALFDSEELFVKYWQFKGEYFHKFQATNGQ